MIPRICTILTAFTAALLAAACATTPGSDVKREHLVERADAAIEDFRRADPAMKRHFFKSSAGYVVFPAVRKGGAFWGGAFGRGVLYDKGTPVGYAKLTQATLGFQLGGQQFKQIIFFEKPEDVARFKRDELAFSGQVSGVAATKGVSGTVNYRNGVAVFLRDQKGLMYEASIGGQSFAYVPMNDLE